MSFFFLISGTTYPDARGRNSDTHHRMGVVWTLVVHCTKDLCVMKCIVLAILVKIQSVIGLIYNNYPMFLFASYKVFSNKISCFLG